MGNVVPFYAGLGVFLLIWALLAYRRARFDALLLALAGALLLWGEWQRLPDHYRLQVDLGILPAVLLGGIGLLLLVRIFLTRLSILERIGMGALGCILMVPALVILGFISLWIFASGSPGGARPQPAAPENQAAPAPAGNVLREAPR